MVELRKDMFRDMVAGNEAHLVRLGEAFRHYFESAIPSGEYLGWVAQAENEIVGTAGLVIHAIPPRSDNLLGREGYIMNMYVVPGWRRHGIARNLLCAALDFLRDQGVEKASLHPRPDARRLYEQYGFTNSSEMRLTLRRPFDTPDRESSNPAMTEPH